MKNMILRAVICPFTNGQMRGAMVEWLEQLGYGAESRRIA